MTELLAQELTKVSTLPHSRVAASHILTEIASLDRLYDNEPTRDAAYILAKDWMDRGSDLRKAATMAWAKDKKIVGDKPDPTAAVPMPNSLSDGIDAPESAPGAAGAQAAPMNEGDPKHKNHDAKAKKPGDIVSKLRSLKGHRGHMDHADDPVAAAYEQGHRDATKKHADHAQRVGRMMARHAFLMGAKAGAGNAVKTAKRGAGMPMTAGPTQVQTSQPVMKADLADMLAKAFNEQAHPRKSGKFTSKQNSNFPVVAKTALAAGLSISALNNIRHLAEAKSLKNAALQSRKFSNEARMHGFHEYADMHADAARSLESQAQRHINLAGRTVVGSGINAGSKIAGGAISLGSKALSFGRKAFSHSI